MPDFKTFPTSLELAIQCMLVQWGGPSYQWWWNWLAHFISNQSM